MLVRMDMRRLARPLMQELADHWQAMVSLGMRDRLVAISCGGPGFSLPCEFLLDEVRPTLLAPAGRLRGSGAA